MQVLEKKINSIKIDSTSSDFNLVLCFSSMKENMCMDISNFGII